MLGITDVQVGRIIREDERRRAVVPGRAMESTSVRADFPRDVPDGPELRAATTLRLATELGSRLRSREQAARTVMVTVRTADLHDPAKTRTLPESTRVQPGERGCPGRLRCRDHTNYRVIASKIDSMAR
ncbi:hypothetical protein ABT354_32925 [Streptomyces sp. NPDC000594]|uniref:DinB/UmuC family translesion DNA polymerase n=1 Tax=Streptomyces sp. NPDC000594 TaxID=3154261 RepID=UPI0033335542